MSVSRRVRLAWPAAALIALALAPAAAAAQTGAAVLAGTITAASRSAIPDATVEVVSVGQFRADSAGAFRIEHLPAGTLMVRVTRLGFAPALKLVTVRAGEELRLDFVLAPSAQQLDAVVVQADSESRAIDDPTGFDRRRRAGKGGIFVVESDIERRHPIATEQLFRGMPSIKVDTGGILVLDRGVLSLRDFYLPQKDRDQFHTCIGMQVFVDGVAMPQPFDINTISPSRIRAIEVYHGAATTPSELRSSKSACGTVAVWTKSG